MPKNIGRLINFAEGFRGMASPDMLSIFQELVKKLSRTESELMVRDLMCFRIMSGI